MTEIAPNSQISTSFEEVSLGKFLQQKRQELNIDLAKASAVLRIKMEDLNSIENDQLDNLTKKHLYAPGLIRAYAKFLKIDEKEIEAKLSKLSFQQNTENKKHLLINISGENDLTPSKDDFFNFLLIGILLFLILLSIYNSLSDKSSMITSDDLIQKLENAGTGDIE